MNRKTLLYEFLLLLFWIMQSWASYRSDEAMQFLGSDARVYSFWAGMWFMLSPQGVATPEHWESNGSAEMQWRALLRNQ